MPNLSPQLTLPPPPDGGTGFGRWATALLQGLQYAYSAVVFVVNALSQTETAANRPSTPALNHIFFMTTDTSHLYVAVDGAWVQVSGARVVATASLPAAGAARDGTVLIEDAGAGNRNLIIYGGGERFRIDGGAAF